jgi:hypothetical protein
MLQAGHGYGRRNRTEEVNYGSTTKAAVYGGSLNHIRSGFAVHRIER